MVEPEAELEITPVDGGIALAGEVDAYTAPHFAAALAALDRDGAAAIVDLRHVTFMDSSGLREIIVSTTERREAGGDLALRGVTGSIERLFEISGLRDHLTIV